MEDLAAQQGVEDMDLVDTALVLFLEVMDQVEVMVHGQDMDMDQVCGIHIKLYFW